MSEARNLPPLPEHEPAVIAVADPLVLPLPPEPVAAAEKSQQTKRPGSVANVLLILFVVGLVAFIVGIAVASAILGGDLDLGTGWVKDLLQVIKDLSKTRAG